LQKFLQERDNKKAIYIETGARFRDFIEEANYTSQLTAEILKEGGLLPSFLPVWIWTNYLIRHFTGNEHLILDGVCRRLSEAPVLDSAVKFYKLAKPIVLSINVPRELSKQRMKGRGRSDDTDEYIESRLDWYEKEVSPVLKYFRENPDYIFVDINGSGTIDDVRKEILEKVSKI
jgi:adenylate kinase